AIALIGICSARYNRRISAQSSTFNTLLILGGVILDPPSGGQYSGVDDMVMLCRAYEAAWGVSDRCDWD
ncbi:hypothetical protein, partial [Allorhizocola rhizosphaerae]|uniref:hypothetical protein n=1 Tax=Allorhizocola rhizosphaerae TaxID=1872709 RepID=UPI001B8D37D8